MTIISVNAKRLIEMRIKSGFTQSALAKVAGTNTPFISRLEEGRHNPRPHNALKVCRALGVEFDEIFKIEQREGE